ncbi:MAG TPA: 50S ribosomal protein L4 [Candidatus Paceibacterota bacterium]
MDSKIYNQTGKEVGTIKLPGDVFGLKWNETLVHQVAVSMMGNLRTPVAHTKNRGEVAGTGKKPWKQKGTGRARHGSRRSPLWVGGGVTHGPRNEKDYSRKVNKKMKVKALFTILSRKNKEGEILFVDSLIVPGPKTREAKTIISSLSKIKGFGGLTRNRNAAYLALENKKIPTLKSFQNFGNLEVGEVRNLNPLDILKYKYLIVENPEKSLGLLSAKLSK